MSISLPTPRRIGLIAAAALVAVAIVSASVAHPAEAATPKRYLNNDAGSFVGIKDSEDWPYSDVKKNFSLEGNAYAGLFLSTANPVSTNDTSRCAGDEVRVELETKGELSTVYKDWVLVTVRAWLYEGASCYSNDLDGTARMSFWVGPGQSTSQSMVVHNDDEGGDEAFIRFNMTNEFYLSQYP